MKHILLNATTLPLIAMAAATEGAVAAEDKPKKEKAPKIERLSQNGVSRPANGTKTSRVWEIADAISAANQRPALREEVMTQGEAEGLNKGTIATQYARWTVFNGVSSTDRSAARAAVRAANAPAETAEE